MLDAVAIAGRSRATFPLVARAERTAGGDFAAVTLRFSRGVIIAAAFAGALCLAAGVATPAPVQYAAFVLSLVLFGLPHGATDHLVPSRLCGERVRLPPLACVIAAYVLTACAYLAVWFASPLLALAFFIVLTWFHWGQGDLHALLRFAHARHLPTRAQRVLTVFVRGGLPMLVPLVAHAEDYRAAATEFVRLFGADDLSGVAWAFAPSFRVATGGTFALVVLFSLCVGFRRAGAEGARAWRADAGETLLLACCFVLLPPVLSIGLYFCFWHSTRHIARLVRLAAKRTRGRRVIDEDAAANEEGVTIASSFGRFMRDAAPCTLAALALLGGLFWLLPQTTLAASVALYLVLLSALTVPHTLVVLLMDFAEGVWSVRRDLRSSDS